MADSDDKPILEYGAWDAPGSRFFLAIQIAIVVAAIALILFLFFVPPHVWVPP